MAIPEHVKRQAMSAVAAARPFLEGMADARPPEPKQADYPPADHSPVASMPDSEKQKAMSAVREASPFLQNMQEVTMNDVASQMTPANDNLGRSTSERIARMERSEFSHDAIQQDLTKQDFGRDER